MGADVNIFDGKGYNALMTACHNAIEELPEEIFIKINESTDDINYSVKIHSDPICVKTEITKELSPLFGWQRNVTFGI